MSTDHSPFTENLNYFYPNSIHSSFINPTPIFQWHDPYFRAWKLFSLLPVRLHPVPTSHQLQPLKCAASPAGQWTTLLCCFAAPLLSPQCSTYFCTQMISLSSCPVKSMWICQLCQKAKLALKWQILEQYLSVLESHLSHWCLDDVRTQFTSCEKMILFTEWMRGIAIMYFRFLSMQGV